MMSLLIMVTLLFIGCATTSIMRNASLDEGVPTIFNASFDRVLKAARESVAQSGLQVEEATQLDDQTWIIIGNKGMSGWTWGERVRVTVQKKSKSETLVCVLTKRKHPLNVTATWDYSQKIFSNIHINLRRSSEEFKTTND
jgi:hypothetical protein